MRNQSFYIRPVMTWGGTAVLTLGLMAWVAPSLLVAAENVAPPSAEAPASASATMTNNQKKGVYTILVLRRDETSDSSMIGAIETLAKANGKAVCLPALVTDPSLKPFFKGQKADPATMPMPIALVVAPNGIVTGAFTKAPDEKRFTDAILPEQPLAVRKALSDGKVVVVTMQSAQTTGNAETNKAVVECMADPKNKDKIVSLPVDLDKAENASFLAKLNVIPAKEKQAVTLCLAPPLKMMSKPLYGAVTKDLLAASISSSCASGCSTGS